MGRLVKNELFKLRKKNSTWIMILLMFAFMILVPAINISSNFKLDSYQLITVIGISWMVLTLISAAGTILSMEYEYGTIKELFASKYSRGKILMSKWFTIFIYSVILNLLLAIFTAVIYYVGKLTTNAFVFNWTDNFPKTNELMWVHFLKMLAGTFITTWLILSLVFLLASIIKKSSMAVILGLALYFSSNIIAGMLSALMEAAKIEWLKFSPFNMLMLNFNESTQELAKYTFLTANELAIGALIYIVVFLFIGLLFYRRKEV